MKKSLAMIGFTAGLMTAAAAQADVGVIGQVGTTGIGAHAVLPITPNVNARLGMGYLSYSYSGSTRNLDYDLSMRTKTYDALLDWYPRQDSAFRVTAGVAYNGNKIDVQARSNTAGEYVINGNSYNASSVGKVTGKVDFGKLSPYLGIGWGKSTAERGWSFSTDVGVLFQGAPRTSLNSSGCSAPAAVCNQFASDVEKENANLRDKVDRFKLYPVLRIGVSYKF